MGWKKSNPVANKYIYIYIYREREREREVKMRKNSIRFQIIIQLESNFASRVSFNLSFKIFVPSELIPCKNWILIRV